MKGVILIINRDVELVDISHAVRPHDVLHAAFLLKSVYAYFPSDTIHIIVVDPEVGSARRALLASSEKGLFIAPDNGVLSGIYDDAGVGEVRDITADHYFVKPRTGTFDGRDVFAPVVPGFRKE
jgi:S-adenosylmethionine hydrolase